ncbi:NEDD4-binding protein 2 [Hyperolius riggenbachi]|uniref:NEDD4-binding protein 2 n=1 Tax=Hyperolius riggenbachi TaxID=752182 RepID=UPI0035A3451F
MPRKRKSLSVSPQRKVYNPSASVALSSSATLPLPPAMGDNKEMTLSGMCEMFPNLDPSLVEMVLSDYKEVEIVMDYLLELSTSAKGEDRLESTGFEEIFHHMDDVYVNSHSSEDVSLVPDTSEGHLDHQSLDGPDYHDFDMLLDEALDRYALADSEDLYTVEQCENPASRASSSTAQPGPPPEDTSFQTEQSEETSHTQNSLDRKDQLHSGVTAYNHNKDAVTPMGDSLNFKTLPDTNDCFLQRNSETTFMSSEVSATQNPNQSGTQSVVVTAQSHLPGVSSTQQIKWNAMAPAFIPTSNPTGGAFITPVIPNPNHWHFPALAREPGGVICYSAPVPSPYVWRPIVQTQWPPENVKPVVEPEPRVQPGPQSSKKALLRLVGKVLVLLRGAPGSGKSTLARMILQQNPTGVILSTDDYFCLNGKYHYDVNCLSEAHEWNHKRAKEAFEKTVSPVIIDNTNLQAWEMKPYVSMAMAHRYKVKFQEPDTWWRYRPKELERRNSHGVKKDKIIRMLEHYERVTVNSMLNLSHPKKPESTVTKPLTAEVNRGCSKLASALEDNLCTEEEPKNTSNTAASAEKTHVSEIENSSPENLLDLTESQQQSLQNLDSHETYSDIIQGLENICIENELSSHENVPSEICQQGVAKDEEDPSNLSSKVLQLGEKNDLLSFIGDWPVEQTMRQRKPRDRKKTKASVQETAEDDQSVDYNLEQILSNPEPIPSNGSSTLGANLNNETTNDDNCITELEKMENNLNMTPIFTNNENGALLEHSFGESIGCHLTDFPQEDPEITAGNPDSASVKTDSESMQKSGKRVSRQRKLAVTFSNSCSSNSTPHGSLPVCEYLESIDQSCQTKPHMFAVAWRVEKKNMDTFESLKILTGKADRFKPKSLDTPENSQENIPYRMIHHKGTSVKEDELISLTDEDGLQILSKLFRALSFDVLKDLFEKCNKDLLWATNVLIDAGEHIYKDDEYQPEDLYTCEEESSKPLESSNHLDASIHHDGSQTTNDNLIVNEEQSMDLKVEDISMLDSDGIALENCAPVIIPSVQVDLNNVSASSSIEELPHINQEVILDPLLPDQHPVDVTVEVWSSSLEEEQYNCPNAIQSLDIATNEVLNESFSEDDTAERLNYPDVCGFYQNNESQGQIPIPPVDSCKQNTNEKLLRVPKDEAQKSALLPPKDSVKFDYLEFSLPPELAFQLTELFGPVGIDPGSLTIEDCVVPIDLKLAEVLHKKWKESIMERHNQEALAYQLLFEEGNSPNDYIKLDSLLQEQEAWLTEREFNGTQEDTDPFPFVDHWSSRTNKVSLRQIMSEEMAIQAREDTKKSLSITNCAVKMKEKQLLELFPNLEQKLLLDIFKEHNYSFEKTEEFLSSILAADPVQNVVAAGFKLESTASADKTKEKKVKADKEGFNGRYYQDFEDPDYHDFRAEAFLYRKKQQESYKKAAEAHHRGMKQVAAYYAQQGYLYGQKMKAENLRAAVQIFERANEYLLPENILDLHGLHVDEAMKHFRRVLQEKTEEYKKNGGKPHLLVITGRGNHSQGGVPRIKPAVVDYLTNHDYRFQEKMPGVLRIPLK